MNSNNTRGMQQRLLMVVPLCLFLSNFSLFSIMGQKIRPLEVVVPIIYLVVNFRTFKMKPMAILMLLLPFGAYFSLVDCSSFASSYIFFVIEVFVLYLAIGTSKYVDTERKEKIIVFVLKLFIFCAYWGMAQFILANFLGSKALYNCFGSLQYHPHYENTLLGMVRATSIFYEPSVFGWMSLFVYVLNQYTRFEKYYKKINVLVVISLVISFSSSAIVGFGIIFIIELMDNTKKNSFVLRVLLLFVVAVLLGVSGINIESMLRLNTLNVEGSSGFNRVQYPFDAMIQTLKAYPLFGRGIGQIGIYDPSIENYSYIYNSIFGIIVTFGVSGLLIYQQIFSVFRRWYKINKHTIVSSVLILYLLISNGSFLTLEFPVIMIILNYAIEYCELGNKKSCIDHASII